VLQTESRNLENRVKERTEELESKTNQLRASSYIVRQIIEYQDVHTLLSGIVQLISEQFGFYHVGIFLLDDQRRMAVLQAASSGEGQRMLERGYHVAIEDMNIVGRVAERRKFIILTDMGSSAAPLTKHPELPLTRSELALPLMVRGKVLGVLDIHSDGSQAFGPNEAEVLQALADQLAISIDNVRLLNDTRAFVSQLETLTAQQTQVSWQEYLRRRNLAYQYTPAGIRQIAPGASNKGKSALRMPLRLRGQEIGTITVQRKEASVWKGAERELTEKIATQVALALDNSRLLEDSRRRAVQEQTVSEIAARLSRSLDIDSLLQTAVRELSALPEVAEVAVFIGEQNDKGHKADVK
jgi:GAF domain-containing protein